MSIHYMYDIGKLKEIASDYECTCDEGPPWNKCAGCKAGGALNNIAEIAGNSLIEINDDKAKIPQETPDHDETTDKEKE